MRRFRSLSRSPLRSQPGGVGASAAFASNDSSPLVTTDSSPSSTTTITDDDVCEEARTVTATPGDCAAVVTTTSDRAEVAGPAQVSTEAALTSEGLSLQAAAASTTIYTRTWSQTARGLYYVNWTEKHTGRVYYDNAGHVWSTTSRSGYKGSHTCGQGSGIGYSVSVTKCSTEQRPDLSGASGHPISEWDYYQVHVVAKGIPIYASHNQHVNIYPSGNIFFE